jgi:hypothetical protein
MELVELLLLLLDDAVLLFDPLLEPLEALLDGFRACPCRYADGRQASHSHHHHDRLRMRSPPRLVLQTS